MGATAKRVENWRRRFHTGGLDNGYGRFTKVCPAIPRPIFFEPEAQRKSKPQGWGGGATPKAPLQVQGFQFAWPETQTDAPSAQAEAPKP